jgi:2-haloacid dehalogenase
VSGTEKLVKPDAAIYQLALARFDLEPGAGLFVDDRIENVAAARDNGFIAHHFIDAPTLWTALADYGVTTLNPPVA